MSSGLEKFEDSAAWRDKLRKHLLMDRPLPVKSGNEPIMERRFNLGFDAEFAAILKAKRDESEKSEMKDEIEVDSPVPKPTATTSEGAHLLRSRECTQLDDLDESFDAFERMCDKTGSDPDSTLFQYLHSNDKEQVLELAKRRSGRSSDNYSDMETDVLRRMLAEVDSQDQLSNESPAKGADCTQLEDIEAPSRLWDNTLNQSNDTTFQPMAKTSPVKMVGLLRPSTILEANETDLSGYQSEEASSLSSSFQTARKSTETIASVSSCYETAADNSLASSTKDNVAAPATINVDDLFYAAIKKVKPLGMSKVEEQELLSDLHGTLRDQVETQLNETILSDGGAEDTIIELSSSSDEDNASYNIKQEESSMCEEFSEDIKIDVRYDSNLQESPLRESGIEDDKENDKSLQFNDSMERVEYMMQKGLEYMERQKAKDANAAATPLADANVVKMNLLKQNTFVVSPKATPMASVRDTPKIGQKKEPASSRFAINMNKPQSKFFKEPTGIPMRLQPKSQKDPYAHIVSPIRAYTQKSSTAPLMSKFRQQSQNLTDAFHRLSIQKLEEESRWCQMRHGQHTTSSGSMKKSIDGLDPKGRLLPKKAYISSEMKQMIDERTPIPMPNVPKIQKYLNSAVEPTVLRHDGKMKLPNAAQYTTPHSNQSLADLSLASGDISLYTIKDAQKF